MSCALSPIGWQLSVNEIYPALRRMQNLGAGVPREHLSLSPVNDARVITKQIIYCTIPIAFLLALVISSVYKSWPQLNPELIASTPLNSECDLRAGPCTGILPDGGSITFNIEPKTIPVMQALQFTVGLDGLSGKGVEIDFQGVDMSMGYNRFKLKALHNRLFKGEGVLPICTRAAMEWEARVLVQTDLGLVAAPFRFVTIR